MSSCVVYLQMLFLQRSKVLTHYLFKNTFKPRKHSSLYIIGVAQTFVFKFNFSLKYF